MTQSLYVLAALMVGAGGAVQLSMLSQMSRLRGPAEAAWVNVLGAVAALAILFGVQVVRSEPPNLPAPFNSASPYLVVAVVTGIILAISVRGIEPYLVVTGVFGFLYLFGAGYIAPKVGIALFASAATAGTLIASLGLDHVGAFGADVQRINGLRIAGLAALIVGVALVRINR